MTKWLEIDFVATKADKTYYIQSCLTLDGEESEKIKFRETRSLNKIHDSFQKILIVADQEVSWTNENGIKIMGIKEFLLNFLVKESASE